MSVTVWFALGCVVGLTVIRPCLDLAVALWCAGRVETPRQEEVRERLTRLRHE